MNILDLTVLYVFKNTLDCEIFMFSKNVDIYILKTYIESTVLYVFENLLIRL